MDDIINILPSSMKFDHFEVFLFSPEIANYLKNGGNLNDIEWPKLNIDNKIEELIEAELEKLEYYEVSFGARHVVYEKNIGDYCVEFRKTQTHFIFLVDVTAPNEIIIQPMRDAYEISKIGGLLFFCPQKNIIKLPKVTKTKVWWKIW